MPERLYAVGDIHGCHDLLTAALDAIERHADGWSATVIFLGDYVDRGPDSRAVVETLMAGPRRPGDRFICLLGNHEDMLLAAAGAPEDDEALLTWLANGGASALRSYAPERGDEARADAVPQEHRAWMAGLPLLHEDRYRIYVHAGLMPGVPTDKQSRETLLWVREPFLLAGDVFGKHVVHGHTPQPEGPELLSWRTNLDTGAVLTGRLSVGVFDPEAEGGPLEVLSITRG